MGHLPNRGGGIDAAQQFQGGPDRDRNRHPDCPVFYKGVRSMSALQELKKAGFSKLNNLEGGIDRWALEVDTDMPRY